MGEEKEYTITKKGIELLIAAYNLAERVDDIVLGIIDKKVADPKAYAIEALQNRVPPEGAISIHIGNLAHFNFRSQATDLEENYNILKAYASGELK